MDKHSMVVEGEPARVTRNGRRYYSRAHKDAVIAKCLVPGASLAAVALANGFNANLVRRWVLRWQARQGLTHSSVRMVPVTVKEEPAAAANVIARPGDSVAGGSMQIRVGRIELVVRGAVEREPLAVVLDMLLRSQ